MHAFEEFEKELYYFCEGIIASKGSKRRPLGRNPSQCNTDSHGKIICEEDGDKDEFCVELSDVLMFATGSSAIPPLGFKPTPSLFFHSNGPLPTANTCTN